ncbi:MAG: DUF1257 domain-containing protein [Chloroflexota bacterium]|nr:MAG: hypothetical protein DLM70_03410 [Chloroflexota bacterium]
MSKYLTFPDIVFKDRQLILAALAELGYADVEEGDALSLYGYRGDRRPETAEIVVRRQHVGSLSNDIGFTRTPQGYVPLVSEYDQRTAHGGQFLVKLRTAYSERVIEEVRHRLHGTAQRRVDGSLIKIRVRF